MTDEQVETTEQCGKPSNFISSFKSLYTLSAGYEVKANRYKDSILSAWPETAFFFFFFPFLLDTIQLSEGRMFWRVTSLEHSWMFTYLWQMSNHEQKLSYSPGSAQSPFTSFAETVKYGACTSPSPVFHGDRYLFFCLWSFKSSISIGLIEKHLC